MVAAAKLNIVVVDDQLTIRALVRNGLQQIGVKDVRDFAGAAEAWPDMVATPPHIVVSDFNMPGMDGLEFLRGIRAHPQLKTVGFLLLTGRADKDLVMRAAQFGANNYIVKPFTVAALKQKIEQVVGPLT